MEMMNFEDEGLLCAITMLYCRVACFLDLLSCVCQVYVGAGSRVTYCSLYPKK